METFMLSIYRDIRCKWFKIGLAAMVIWMLSGPDIQAQLLDDFNDGDDVGWTHYTMPRNTPGANWDASSGVYRLWTDWFERGQVISSELDITSDPSYSNGYWWATVVRENADSWCNLLMRFDAGAINSYQFGWFHNQGLFISRSDNGSFQFLVTDPGIVMDVGIEYIMEAGAFGPELELRMWRLGDDRPELPQLFVRDVNYATGTNGVSVGAFNAGAISASFDDVSFGQNPGGPALVVTGDCPGRMSATTSNADPDDLIVLVYGFEEGQTTAVPGCPGLLVDIVYPRIAAKGRANDQGEYSVSGKVRASACGLVILQAVNVTGCAKSEVVGL